MVTVSQLLPEHVGRRAIVTTHNGPREGELISSRNSAYRRIDVTYWWLLVPSARFPGERDALSLQWAGPAEVEFLDTECEGAGAHFVLADEAEQTECTEGLTLCAEHMAEHLGTCRTCAGAERDAMD